MSVQTEITLGLVFQILTLLAVFFAPWRRP